ncbi:anaphase-promoting complex subunit 2 isoform X2 [Plodia interpunctella]|uniref:anaphase-promoting complex subunit 2 isoform X2 n=2 Tax=Plodia interpunctella TaxID=58824 RepID=UPI0023676978|nr:anaphase-promoting complex subunit 2 isoform X2 [Plodia interpunctella]
MSHKKGDLKIYWNKINYAFPILNDTTFSDCTSAEYEEIQQIIVGLGIQIRIRDLALVHIEKYLRQHVAPSFWSKFIKAEEEVKGFQLFKSAVNDLYESVSSFQDMLRRLTVLNSSCCDNKPVFGEKDVIMGFKQQIRATLLSQLPLDYHIIINHFYKVSFNVFDNEYEYSDMGEDVMCSGCWNEYSDCNCSYIVKVFHDTNRKLMDLQLLERLTGQVLTNFIQTRIESHIQKLCDGTFDVSHIGFLENWLDTTVMSWLTRIYCAGSSKPPPDDKNIQNAISKFKQKLSYYLYHSYTKLRIDQLFNIIIDYPDSQPAVEDIKLCLCKTDLRASLCKNLQAALETRLLHHGVNTTDILTAYVSTIRALRHLDPSGVILETVTKPVRNYLRNREDTVRSVVSSLTEDSAGSELAEELAKFAVDGEGEIDKDEAWDEWNPDPVDADPKVNSSDRKANDIISMLVNVYGSKELFVNEYRTLLADRLLAQGVINTEKEIRYLELLKLRFGESQLHFCEVMLKDISDSKRINALIQQDKDFEAENKKFASNAMILSAQFWPPFKDETLELPEEIQNHFKSYTKSYEALKGNRTLDWKPHLGNVNIEIEIGNKKLDLTVSPFNATLIMHFQTKPEWSLEELHQAMKVPVTILRRKITYWQSMGLVSEKSSDVYVLVDGSDANKSSVASNQVQEMICEDDEAESVMASAHDQRERDLQVFWSYIFAMLTNLNSLPLDRIHQMLKMFAPGTECSLQELRQFLDTKVRTHQLVLQGGMYMLPKT